MINGYLGDRGLSLFVDATLIHAPSSTKNQDGKCDPEMHQAKKGNQWYFGMKAHIGVDDESGLVHSVVGTAANLADSRRSISCCTATKTWSVPMPVIPAWRNAPNMKVARSSGRLPPDAAPTRNWASAASCTKPRARSKKPRRS